MNGFLTGTAGAQTSYDWTNPGLGDWFDTTNWISTDPPAVPGPPGISDNSSIFNGGTAVADGNLVAPGTILQTTRIHVGSTSIANGGPAAPNDLVGALELIDIGMDLNQLLWVGVMKGSLATAGRSATGMVTATGSAPIDVSVAGIGIAENTAGDVVVQGNLTSDGFLTGLFAGFGGVGIVFNAGSSVANGHVVANNGADVGLQTIGFADQTGMADGSFTVTNGDLTLPASSQFLIGRSQDSGVATGHLEVANGAILKPDPPANVFGDTLDIGHTFVTGDTVGLPEGTGVLTARSAPNAVFGNSRIGVASGGGIANGTVTFTHGGLSMDDPTGVVGEWDMTVGGSFSAFPSGSARDGMATGALHLGGVLTGAADNDTNTLGVGGSLLDIGVVFGDAVADADGTVNATGVEKFNVIRVGYAGGGQAGALAKGRLNVGADGMVGNGDFFSDLFVGFSVADGDADGGVSVVNGDVRDFSGILYVGRAQDNGTAAGTFDLQNGDIETPRGIAIGTASGDNAETPTATGMFTHSNGTIALQEFAGFVVGSAQVASGTAQVRATGEATLTNVTANAAVLSVGTSTAAGDAGQLADATGTLNLVSSTFNVTNGARIGDAFAGFEGTNNAAGILRMTDSRLTIGPLTNFPGQAGLSVGTAFGTVAQATGEVQLTRSHIEAERMNLGENARLIFDIEGTNRIGEYGAIDIAGCVGIDAADCTVDLPGFAALDGVAEIRFDAGFDFAAALGSAFDLIVASTFSFEDFLGNEIDTYFDDVIFAGLDPLYTASAFIFDGGSFESFRVTLAQRTVPEPGTLLLFLIGAAGLAVASRRR